VRPKLLELRQLLKKSQEQMARDIGISTSHWRQLELGTRNPSLGLATKIAKLADATVDQMFPEE